MCRDCGVVATSQRAHHAAAWLWTELTGSYWEDAPALKLAAWPRRPQSWPSLYRKFARTIPDALAKRLFGWGTELCDRPFRV